MDADFRPVTFPWVATVAAVVVALGATAVALPLMGRSLPTAADPEVSIEIDVGGVRADNASLLFTVGADREDGKATSNRLQILVEDAPSSGVISISLTGTEPSAPMRCFRVEPTQETDVSSIVGARSRVIHELETHRPGSHGGYRWADKVNAGESVRITCILESAFSWSSELGTRYIAVPAVDLHVEGEPREVSSADRAAAQEDEATKCVNLMTPSLATTGYPSTSAQTSATCLELLPGALIQPNGEDGHEAWFAPPYFESIDVLPERTERESRTFWAGLAYGFAAALLAPAATWLDARMRRRA